MTAAVAGFPAPVGAMVEIDRQAGEPIAGEVIGFRDKRVMLMPFEDSSRVRNPFSRSPAS